MKWGKWTYINGNEDIEPIMLRPDSPLIVVFLCCVLAHDECILRELLKKTFWGCAVDIEVEGLNRDEQRAQ